MHLQKGFRFFLKGKFSQLICKWHKIASQPDVFPHILFFYVTNNEGRRSKVDPNTLRLSALLKRSASPQVFFVGWCVFPLCLLKKQHHLWMIHVSPRDKASFLLKALVVFFRIKNLSTPGYIWSMTPQSWLKAPRPFGNVQSEILPQLRSQK